MALMDSLLNAAASAIGGAGNGQQNTVVQMVLDLVQQSGGVGNLINQLQQGVLGGALESWISTGGNQSVSGSDL